MPHANLSARYEKFQDFLDQVQYSKQGIARYEWIFGETYLSTGGARITEEVLSKIQLPAGARVLDVGSGLGGSSFAIAEKFNAQVFGVDLSRNIMAVALRNLEDRPHLKDKVHFTICDVTQADYPEASYDLIFSRGLLLHIADKRKLFGLFYRWLRPGGKILFTEYVRGSENTSEEFNQYVAQRSYSLPTREQYRELMEGAGFVKVEAQDWQSKFVAALTWELEKLRNGRKEFLGKFSIDDYQYLERGWLAKLKRVQDNDQSWVLGYAEKPL